MPTCGGKGSYGAKTMKAVPSEREIIMLLLQGLGCREMADRLGLSEAETRERVARTLRDLGSRSRDGDAGG